MTSPRRGFSLTELGIVLGITGLLLGVIWQGASFVYFNLKLNRTVQQLETIVYNVRSLYAMGGNMKQPNYTVITSNMIAADVFPPDVEILPGGYPINPFGGQYAIESQGNCQSNTYTLGTCDETTFEVEIFPPVDVDNARWDKQTPCAALATRILGTGRDPGMVALYTDTEGWRDPATITINDIAKNCYYISIIYKLHVDRANG